MKSSNIFLISAVTAALISTASCTLETSDNGDLDGFWHLERIDTLSTGGVCELSDSLRFWAIQKNLLNVTDMKQDVYGFIMRFENSGANLRVYDPYENNRMEGDPKLENASILAPFGINATDETFTIDVLNSSDMKLRTDKLRLHFHKM